MGNFKSLGIAFLGVLIVSTIIFYIFGVLIGVDQAISQAAASIPLASLPKFYEELEKRAARKDFDTNREAPSHINLHNMSGFTLHPGVLVLYATVIVFAVNNFSMFYSAFAYGAVIQILGAQHDGVPKVGAIGIIGLPVVIIGIYLVGRWIGSRSSRRGFWVPIAAILLSFVLARIIDFKMGNEFAKELFGEEVGATKEFFAGAIKLLLMHLSILSPVVILGYWRGRRMVVPKYMNYLLGTMPQETREALVNLAFEEAQTSISKSRKQSIGVQSYRPTQAR